MWKNCNPCTLLTEMQNGTAIVENDMVILKKNQTWNWHAFQESHFWDLCKTLKIGMEKDSGTPTFIVALFA